MSVPYPNANTDKLNADIMAFVNGKDGMDASKLARMYHLMVYNPVTNETDLSERVQATFGNFANLPETGSGTPVLDDISSENSVPYVKNGLVSYFDDQNLAGERIEVPHMLGMVRSACYETFRAQMQLLRPNANLSNLRSVFDKFTDLLDAEQQQQNTSEPEQPLTMSSSSGPSPPSSATATSTGPAALLLLMLLRSGGNLDSNDTPEAVRALRYGTPLVKQNAMSRESREYVVDLQQFVQRVSDAMFAMPVDRLSSSVFDDNARLLLVYMLTPWMCMRFLASFVPGPWNARLNNGFHANFQDMQYATLAMYKVMFDTLNHMQKYIERNDASSEPELEKLASIALKITHTLGSVYVADRKRKFPEWQLQVSDRSEKTKEMSVELYQLGAQLEQRKANLLVMLHNQRELETEAAWSRRIFWAAVAVYIVIVVAMIGLLAGGRFYVLYVFATLVVAIPVAWWLIRMVRGNLR